MGRIASGGTAAARNDRTGRGLFRYGQVAEEPFKFFIGDINIIADAPGYPPCAAVLHLNKGDKVLFNHILPCLKCAVPTVIVSGYLGAYLIGKRIQKRAHICICKGTVEIRPLESGGDNGLMFSDLTFTNDNAWAARGETVRFDGFHRYRTMMAFFAAMVRGEETNPYTPDYELALHDFVMRSCGVEVEG